MVGSDDLSSTVVDMTFSSFFDVFVELNSDVPETLLSGQIGLAASDNGVFTLRSVLFGGSWSADPVAITVPEPFPYPVTTNGADSLIANLAADVENGIALSSGTDLLFCAVVFCGESGRARRHLRTSLPQSYLDPESNSVSLLSFGSLVGERPIGNVGAYSVTVQGSTAVIPAPGAASLVVIGCSLVGWVKRQWRL